MPKSAGRLGDVPRRAALPTMLASLAAKSSSKSHGWVEQLEASLGQRMSRELRTLIAWAGSLKSVTERGDVLFGSEWPASSPDPKKWRAGLLKTSIAPQLEAFTGTVWLGSDSSGNMYFADASPHSSEVYVYDHETSDLRRLASSVTEFVRLQQLVDYWLKLEERLGRSAEELVRADFAKPPLAELRAALRELAVTLPVGGEARTDSDESVPLLAGKKLRHAPRATLPLELYAGSRWLPLLLFHEVLGDLRAAQRRKFAHEIADPRRGPLRATKLYWLWHLYLFGRDAELLEYSRSLEKDRSLLVERTSTLMQELLSAKRSAQLDEVRKLRELVLSEIGGRRVAKVAPDPAAWLDAFLAAPRGDSAAFSRAIEHFSGSPSRCRAESLRFSQLLGVMRAQPKLVSASFGEVFVLGTRLDRYRKEGLEVYRCLLALPIPKDEDEREDWLRAGNNAIISAQIAKDLEAGRELCQRLARHASKNPYIFHSAACLYADLGELELCVENIRQAVRHDYEHLDKLRVDTDLLKLLGRERLQALVPSS